MPLKAAPDKPLLKPLRASHRVLPRGSRRPKSSFNPLERLLARLALRSDTNTPSISSRHPRAGESRRSLHQRRCTYIIKIRIPRLQRTDFLRFSGTQLHAPEPPREDFPPKRTIPLVKWRRSGDAGLQRRWTATSADLATQC